MFVVNDIHVTVEVNNVTVHLLITLIVVSCLVFVVNDIYVTVEVNDVNVHLLITDCREPSGVCGQRHSRDCRGQRRHRALLPAKLRTQFSQ